VTIGHVRPEAFPATPAPRRPVALVLGPFGIGGQTSLTETLFEACPDGTSGLVPARTATLRPQRLFSGDPRIVLRGTGREVDEGPGFRRETTVRWTLTLVRAARGSKPKPQDLGDLSDLLAPLVPPAGT
jgi:hypothetical protein